MATLGLAAYLKKCVDLGASDIFFQAGSPVYAKIGGIVKIVGEERLTPRDTMRIIIEMYEAAGDREGQARDRTSFDTVGDDDFSFFIQDVARFRANAYHQRGSVGAVVRVVTFNIPNYKDINIPDEVIDLMDTRSGLIVVCGPAGSGKSTTQACMIDAINHKREGHVVTIEDPIEYIHTNDKCLITQREVPIDAQDFDSALRAALRQAPDVILLGEMRDFETIRAVVTAAETGHLVIATLHTQGAVSSIDRIIDSFPPNQQSQIRLQVSMVLRAVVSQRLLPCKDNRLRPAFEIMRSNLAVQSLIRECQTYQIWNTMASGRSTGMVMLDESVFNLYKDGYITEDTALLFSQNYDVMKRRINGEAINGAGNSTDARNRHRGRR